jgi:tetratricopeptide (TPR) repeat protein
LLVINGMWAGEFGDDSLTGGKFAFALAGYDDNFGSAASARLLSLKVESRLTETEEIFKQWKGQGTALAHFRLAEGFEAVKQYDAALIEVRHSWSVLEKDPPAGEYLFACHLAKSAGAKEDALLYAGQCLDAAVAEGAGDKDAMKDLILKASLEKASLLYDTARYKEAVEFITKNKALPKKPKESTPKSSAVAVSLSAIKTILGHSYGELGKTAQAMAAYDDAFALDPTNGLAAKYAGKMAEFLEKKDEAMDRYMAAGKLWLSTENWEELGGLVPTLTRMGEKNPEAHALAGLWAAAVGETPEAQAELTAALALLDKRKKTKPELVSQLIAQMESQK